MKRFFGKNGIWLLFIAVIAAVTLCVVNFFSVKSSPLSNFVNTVLSPVRSGISELQEWAADKKAHFGDYDALSEENRALKVRVAELEEALRQAESDREENLRLRSLLGLKQQHRDYELEKARIISRSANNWECSLTLNRGSNDGIEPGDCAITETGALAGIVKECGGNWCKVLCITDTDSSLGAFIFRTEEDCVASGDFRQMAKGRLTAQYIDPNSSIMVGDLIVTSGLGGYYPAGLTIGTVESLQPDPSGLSLTAVLQPSAELNEITQLFIIKDFTVTD